MKLTLVRHGESKQNEVLHQSRDPSAIVFKQANPELTAIGFQQAQYTGKHLASEEPVEVWVSQLTRANQTLAEIKPFLPNAQVVQLFELNEKNERVAGVRERESLQEFSQRVAKFCKSLERDRDLLIVGHSMFISVLTSLLLGEAIQEPLVYRNPNCAITRLERVKQGWVKHCQGSVEHIPLELRTGSG